MTAMPSLPILIAQQSPELQTIPLIRILMRNSNTIPFYYRIMFKEKFHDAELTTKTQARAVSVKISPIKMVCTILLMMIVI